MKIYLSALAVALLLQVGQSAVLVTNNHCNDVESACANYGVARHCGVVEQCLDAWSSPVITTGDPVHDVACLICKDGVNMLETYLSKNATKAEIEKEMMNICSDIPFASVSTECSQTVAENFDQMYDDIVVLTNADLICPALGVCTTSSTGVETVAAGNDGEDDLDENIRQLLQGLPDMAKAAYEKNQLPVMSPYISPVPIFDTDVPKNVEDPSTYCSDCTAFMTDLQGVAANNKSIIANIEDLVKQQCETLGEPLSALCAHYLPKLIQSSLATFESDDVNTLCQNIYMCPQETPSKLKVSTGDLCNDCQAFTQDWQSIIQNNQTIINEINAQIKDQLCSQFFPLEHECDRKADQLQKMLLPMIVKTDAYTICSTMYMCDDEQKHQVVTEQVTEEPQQEIDPGFSVEVPANDPVSCTACIAVSELLAKEINKNSTETEVIMALEKVCTLVGKDISEECDALVENYGDDLVKFIIAEITSGDICKKLGLCMLEEEPKIDVSSDVTCEVCEFFATELDKLVTKDSTEEEIKEALEQVCNYLPKSFSTQCTALVETYIQVIVQEIVNGLSPKNICGASGLNLCPALEMTQVQTNPLCAVCTLVAVQLSERLADNATQAQIIEALDEACKSVPLQPFASDCVIFVESKAPEILTQLADDVHPRELCHALRVCPALSDDVQEQNREVQKEKEIESLEGKIVCELCSVVAAKLDQLIDQDSTQDEIEAALDKVCALLPADYVDQCDTLVARYKSYMVQVLLEFASPQQVCGFLRLCPTQVKLGGEACTICTLVAVELDNALSDKDTEAEITAKVKAVCGYLPSSPASLRTDCDQFISDNMPLILDQLANDIKPKQLCAAIHMCTATKVHKKTATPAAVVPAAKLHVQGGELCQVCKLVIEDLDQVLAENATKQDVENALEKVCMGLPSQLMDTCDEVVEEYAPQIIDMADNILQPDYVCKHLGVCSARKPALIGANPCSYGPSYWCNDHDSAQKCNAVTFCMQHYW